MADCVKSLETRLARLAEELAKTKNVKAPSKSTVEFSRVRNPAILRGSKSSGGSSEGAKQGDDDLADDYDTESYLEAVRRMNQRWLSRNTHESRVNSFSKASKNETNASGDKVSLQKSGRSSNKSSKSLDRASEMASLSRCRKQNSIVESPKSTVVFEVRGHVELDEFGAFAAASSGAGPKDTLGTSFSKGVEAPEGREATHISPVSRRQTRKQLFESASQTAPRKIQASQLRHPLLSPEELRQIGTSSSSEAQSTHGVSRRSSSSQRERPAGGFPTAPENAEGVVRLSSKMEITASEPRNRTLEGSQTDGDRKQHRSVTENDVLAVEAFRQGFLSVAEQAVRSPSRASAAYLAYSKTFATALRELQNNLVADLSRYRSASDSAATGKTHGGPRPRSPQPLHSSFPAPPADQQQRPGGQMHPASSQHPQPSSSPFLPSPSTALSTSPATAGPPALRGPSSVPPPDFQVVPSLESTLRGAVAPVQTCMPTEGSHDRHATTHQYRGADANILTASVSLEAPVAPSVPGPGLPNRGAIPPTAPSTSILFSRFSTPPPPSSQQQPSSAPNPNRSADSALPAPYPTASPIQPTPPPTQPHAPAPEPSASAPHSALHSVRSTARSPVPSYNPLIRTPQPHSITPPPPPDDPLTSAPSPYAPPRSSPTPASGPSEQGTPQAPAANRLSPRPPQQLSHSASESRTPQRQAQPSVAQKALTKPTPPPIGGHRAPRIQLSQKRFPASPTIAVANPRLSSSQSRRHDGVVSPSASRMPQTGKSREGVGRVVVGVATPGWDADSMPTSDVVSPIASVRRPADSFARSSSDGSFLAPKSAWSNKLFREARAHRASDGEGKRQRAVEGGAADVQGLLGQSVPSLEEEGRYEREQAALSATAGDRVGVQDESMLFVDEPRKAGMSGEDRGSGGGSGSSALAWGGQEQRRQTNLGGGSGVARPAVGPWVPPSRSADPGSPQTSFHCAALPARYEREKERDREREQEREAVERGVHRSVSTLAQVENVSAECAPRRHPVRQIRAWSSGSRALGQPSGGGKPVRRHARLEAWLPLRDEKKAWAQRVDESARCLQTLKLLQLEQYFVDRAARLSEEIGQNGLRSDARGARRCWCQ